MSRPPRYKPESRPAPKKPLGGWDTRPRIVEGEDDEDSVPSSISIPIALKAESETANSTPDHLSKTPAISRSCFPLSDVPPAVQNELKGVPKRDIRIERMPEPDHNSKWVTVPNLAPGESLRRAKHHGRDGFWTGWLDESRKWKLFTFEPIRRKSRKATKPKKSKTTFLSLPGELRNEVYKRLIPECHMLIKRNTPNKELQRLTQAWSEQGVKHKRPRSRLSHEPNVGQWKQGLELTTNLLLTCKQVRADVESFMYSRTIFCFRSINATDMFLNVASKQGIKAIRRVHIEHFGYGNPVASDHRQYQERYYNKWQTVCARLGRELGSLEHLKLYINLQEWPCDFTGGLINSIDRKACLLMAPQQIKRVEVQLHHRMIQGNKKILRELASKLENEIMTQEGQDRRDRDETEAVLKQLAAKKAERRHIARKRILRENTPSELTTSMVDIKESHSAPVKVCKAGIDKYSKVNPSVMCAAELETFRDTTNSYEKPKPVAGV